MAKTALTQLQDQIEAVRREAFAAGYAAAMQSIRDFAAKGTPAAASGGPPGRRGRRAAVAAPAPVTAPAAAPTRQRQPRGAARAAGRTATRSRRAGSPRLQRGTNARLIEEVLQSNAPRALHPAEIRSALQRDKGVAIAFTSIRHALTQLEGRHAAEQIGDSKTWRYSGGAAG